MASTSGVLQLCGTTHAPRHQAIPAANDVLNECGVILEDMHEYSNRMTTYRFEVAKADVSGLIEGLRAANVVLDGEPEADLGAIVADEEGFIHATLQLTFPEEDGNRRNPNPDMG